MKNITLFLLLFFLGSFQSGLRSQNSKQFVFRENKGQVSDQFSNPRLDILFSGNMGDMVFHLKSNGISYQLNRVDSWEKRKRPTDKCPDNVREKLVPTQSTIYRLDINWINSNTQAQVVKGEALSGYDNYYFASCPTGAVYVKSYTNLLYKNIYAGIDLKWYEKNGNLKYDYYVAADADYKAVQLEYKGAEKIFVDKNGELVIQTPLGILKEQKPLVIQNNKVLEAKWIIKNNIVSFDIKNVDPSLPLIIDPMVRVWATYYGGALTDGAWYTHADASGNVLISGETISFANIATSGAHQSVFGGTLNKHDAFVVKFNAAGTRQWGTYYGGTDEDYGCESNIDVNGNVYLVGVSSSTNSGVIATPGAHQSVYSTVPGNFGDAFLVVFNSSGVRQWGTYCGGDSWDIADGVSFDNLNNIYITGETHSSNGISTSGSHQPALAGNIDGFLIKFNSSGVRQWGTYFGGDGPGQEAAWDCETNASSGDTYICGITTSTNNISTLGSHQTTFGGSADGFIAKFNSSGVLQWGTYYGDTGMDYAGSVASDAFGNVYCSGMVNSNAGTSIATFGSHQPNSGGAQDAFLVKFDPAGTRLWGTFYGGPGNDYTGSTSVDPSGNVYIGGMTGTNSGMTIATPCAYQSQYGGGSFDMFLAKFTSTGRRVWGTYYGSTNTDYGDACAADGLGNIFLVGSTTSGAGTSLATTNGHQPLYGGGLGDAVLVKFDGCIPGSAVNITPPANLLVCHGDSTTLMASCGNWYSTSASTVILKTGDTFTTGAITSDTTFYVEDFGCGSVTGIRTPVNLTVAPEPVINIVSTNSAACVAESITLTANGAVTYSWAPISSASSTLQMFILLNITHTVTGTDANGCKSTATISVAPQLCVGINEQAAVSTQVISYPNPNRGTVTIRSTRDVNLMLTNELGQVILPVHLTSSNNFEVILNDLPNGVYFLTGEKKTGS